MSEADARKRFSQRANSMKDLEPMPFAKAEAENHIARANACQGPGREAAAHYNMHYGLALKFVNALNNLMRDNGDTTVYFIRKCAKNVLSLRT